MLSAVLLLAQTPTPQDPEEILRQTPSRTPSFLSGDSGLIITAILALVAVIFIWAFFFRKRPQTQRGSLVIERAKHQDSEQYGSSGRRRRRKRKSEHPENLPRNPTLAEIGGLPPLRPEEPDPPAEGDAPESTQPQR